jgi:hypothetical protein
MEKPVTGIDCAGAVNVFGSQVRHRVDMRIDAERRMRIMGLPTSVGDNRRMEEGEGARRADE